MQPFCIRILVATFIVSFSNNSMLAQETISSSYVGFGDHAIIFSIYEYVESYSDCKTANQKFNDELSRAKDILLQCRQAPEAGLGNRQLVTVCGRQAYTGWPQCRSAAEDICAVEQARSDFAVKCRNAVAKILADAQTRAEAEAQRRADAGPAEPLGLASDATNWLNNIRNGNSPAQVLSKKLTSMGLRHIQRQGMQNFAMMNQAFREFDNSFSTANPIPTARTLTPPLGFTMWNSLSEQVLEKDYDLLFGNHFASEDGVRELMPELAARAALGQISLAGNISIDEVVKLLSVDREENGVATSAETPLGSSNNELQRRMQRTLAALETTGQVRVGSRRQAQKTSAGLTINENSPLGPSNCHYITEDVVHSNGYRSYKVRNKCNNAIFLFHKDGSRYGVEGHPIGNENILIECSSGCYRMQSDFRGSIIFSCELSDKTSSDSEGLLLYINNMNRPRYDSDPCWALAQCVMDTKKGPGTCW